MSLDNRSARNSSEPASSVRSICGASKRILPTVLLLGLLTIGAASSGVLVVHAAAYGQSQAIPVPDTIDGPFDDAITADQCAENHRLAGHTVDDIQQLLGQYYVWWRA